jgi:hypothetical protein
LALTLWNEGATRAAIEAFVSRVCDESGPDFVPAEHRVAVFDNDGTLWSEKPIPVELGFPLARWAEMAGEDVSLRKRQPWKAAVERDYGWLGRAMNEHYEGDVFDVADDAYVDVEAHLAAARARD